AGGLQGSSGGRRNAHLIDTRRPFVTGGIDPDGMDYRVHLVFLFSSTMTHDTIYILKIRA
ncbi:MAG TPA: hypothetical protein PKV95_01820, partial [Anaerolineaceae bacterium]|nr:hypothetical protein [Anaerolineaceae bacterium]